MRSPRNRRRLVTPLEALERRDVPAAVPLGLNLAFFPEFVDAVKDSYTWDQHVPLDDHGWPTVDGRLVLFDDRVDEWFNGPDPNAHAPDDGGTYHLSFVGQADVAPADAVFNNAAVNDLSYDPATNTSTASVYVTPGHMALSLDFSRTRRLPSDPLGTGVTDVRLIRPGYDPDTTQVFTDRYLAAVRPFDTLRYMDATFTNGYGTEWVRRPLEWSMRHLPDDSGLGATHGSIDSAAWEDLIGLANASHTNMWINLPGPATDDYARQLALLIRDGDTVDGVYYPGLDPDLKVYLEWSNEVWGGITSTFDYNIADVQIQVATGTSPLTSDGDPGTDTGVGGPTLLRNEMLHTRRIAAAFDAVFHDPAHDRIRPVLPWAIWGGSSFPASFAWFESLFGPPANTFYGMGGITYYSPSDFSSVDALLASLAQGERDIMPLVREMTALAHQYGLVNVSYEGGPAIGGQGDAGQVGLAANRDPRIRAIVAQGYADWYANGGDLAMFYDGPYGIWNPAWQLHAAELSQRDHPADSPKYAGLLDVLGTGTTQAPPTISATAASSHEIDLSWTPKAGAARYQLQARPAGTTTWAYQDFTPGETTTYRSPVPHDSTWDYHVRALDAAGNPLTDWSDLIVVTTLMT